MFGQFGATELIIVLAILLLLFGPSRLGDLGSALGKGIRGFKKSLKGDGVDGTQKQGQDRGVDGSDFKSSNKSEVN